MEYAPFKMVLKNYLKKIILNIRNPASRISASSQWSDNERKLVIHTEMIEPRGCLRIIPICKLQVFAPCTTLPSRFDNSHTVCQPVEHFGDKLALRVMLMFSNLKYALHTCIKFMHVHFFPKCHIRFVHITALQQWNALQLRVYLRGILRRYFTVRLIWASMGVVSLESYIASMIISSQK